MHPGSLRTKESPDPQPQLGGWSCAQEGGAPTLPTQKGVGLPPVPSFRQFRGVGNLGHTSPAAAGILAAASPEGTLLPSVLCGKYISFLFSCSVSIFFHSRK